MPRAVFPAVVLIVSAGLLVTGCLGVSPAGGTTDGGDEEGAPTYSPQETAMLEYLRTTDVVRDDLADVPDAELLDVARAICEVVADGGDLDQGMRGLVEDFPLHDQTIAALAVGAQVTYCPDYFDATAWALESPFMRERQFLRVVREQGGRFAYDDDATALGMGRSICQAFDEGESVDTIVSAMHSGSPVGMAPDPEGARAFIAASIVAFCPEADIWQ